MEAALFAHGGCGPARSLIWLWGSLCTGPGPSTLPAPFPGDSNCDVRGKNDCIPPANDVAGSTRAAGWAWLRHTHPPPLHGDPAGRTAAQPHCSPQPCDPPRLLHAPPLHVPGLQVKCRGQFYAPLLLEVSFCPRVGMQSVIPGSPGTSLRGCRGRCRMWPRTAVSVLDGAQPR